MRKNVVFIPRCFVFALLGFLLTVNQQVEGQQIPERLQDLFTPGIYGSSVANYYYAQPGDFTILVSVWGDVRNSGRYEVPVDTNIGQLLSLAGGPGADIRGITGADTWSRRQAGKTIIRLSRLTGGAGREVVLEYRIEDLLRLREQEIPLQEGDIIMIDRVRPFNFWDLFAVINTSASLILVLDRIFGFFD